MWKDFKGSSKEPIQKRIVLAVEGSKQTRSLGVMQWSNDRNIPGAGTLRVATSGPIEGWKDSETVAILKPDFLKGKKGIILETASAREWDIIITG